MSNGGLQQGPGGPLGPLGAQAATEAAREANLNAVRDDINAVSEGLMTLNDTVQRLQLHLMGDQPNIKSAQDTLERAERPTPSGMLPVLCTLGSNNIRHLQRIQEQLNQLCYELGEGR